MRIDRNRMTTEEKTQLELHSLYQKYGYSRYKMGKFEEYDLYLRNKDFIGTENIIAFSDLNGRLMALKPDLTLSIVKNYRYRPGFVQKVYYSENIYRASQNSRRYREIAQTGLECLGDVGLYDTFEVTMLALRSLASIHSDYVLEISHMGVVADLLRDVETEVQDRIVECIGEKNIHELRKVAEGNGIAEETIQALEMLVSTYGDHKRVIRKMRELPLTERGREALDQLSDVVSLLASYKMASRVNIDFSIVNDLTYYSGILFKGFVEGVPKAVLSGGRYDRLMSRMGKKGGALGFAVYLDDLDRMEGSDREYDVEIVFLYTLEDDLGAMYKAVRQMIQEGSTVLVEKEIPEKLRYRKLIRLDGSEVVTVEEND